MPSVINQYSFREMKGSARSLEEKLRQVKLDIESSHIIQEALASSFDDQIIFSLLKDNLSTNSMKKLCILLPEIFKETK